MDRIECPEHEKALYFCPECLKLICLECDSSHDHTTKQIDDFEPSEIKESIEAKFKILKTTLDQVISCESGYKEIKETQLYFTEKKFDNEVNPQLFSELGMNLSAIQKKSRAIKDLREKFDVHIFPSLESLKTQVAETEHLLSTFAETSSDPDKFFNEYRTRSEYKTLNQAEIAKDAEALSTLRKEYDEEKKKLFSILEKYWFEGFEHKIALFQSIEADSKAMHKKLSELKETQTEVSQSNAKLSQTLEQYQKQASSETEKLRSILDSIKIEQLQQDVKNLLESIQRNRRKLEDQTKTLTSLTEKNAILEMDKKKAETDLDNLKNQITKKTEQLQLLNDEHSAKGKEMQELLDKSQMLNMKVDSTLLYIKTELETSQEKFDGVQQKIEDVAVRYEEYKIEVEEMDKTVKDKRKEIEKLKNEAYSQKKKLRENNMSLEKLKLEIADYLKYVTSEIEKSAEISERIQKKMNGIDEKKTQASTWLCTYRQQLVATIVALEGMKRRCKKTDSEVENKLEKLVLLNEKWSLAKEKAEKLEKLFKTYDSQVKKLGVKVQKYNEEFVSKVENTQAKVKEFSSHIDKAREDYMRDKCGVCIHKTSNKLKLQCGHSLCESCAESALMEYQSDKESFSLQCAICNYTNSSILYPLNCGCSVELTELPSFKRKIKEETRGYFCYYNSYELAILPPTCPKGHPIKDSELRSLFPDEEMDLGGARAELEKMLDQDNANPKRVGIINAIKGKTEANNFNTRFKLGNDGARFLGDALKTLKNLEKIDLDANLIEDKGIIYLSLMLPNTSSTLKVLDVRRNMITDEGMKHIAKAMRQIQGLREFFISSNKLGAKSGSYLAEALPYLKVLKILHLSQNELGPDGCACLCSAIADHSSLEALYFSNNKIMDEGVAAFGRALITNKSLLNVIER